MNDLLVAATIVLLRCSSICGLVSAMQSHRLIVLGWAALAASCLPSFSDHNGYDIGDPCDGSEDAVHDWAIGRVVG